MSTTISIILAAGGLLIANYGTKLGRAYPLFKQVHETIEETVSAKKDGKLTMQEKAKLYDSIVDCYEDAYSIMKGFFPNKTIK